MKLSIIIPFVKDRGWLSKAIESVEAQTVPCELILSQSNASCAVNLQKGLDRVQTEYYAVCADDDWLHPKFAERMLEGIEDADLAFSDAWRWRGDNSTIYRSSYYGLNDLIKGTRIHGGAVMYRTETVKRLGGYDTELTTAEEYELHLRMSYEYCTFTYVGFALYNYRIHGDNKSMVKRGKTAERKAYINEIRSRFR